MLNKYYSFIQPFGLDWTFWYIRESSTALIAANLPLTWTFLQRVFNLKSFREKYHSNTRSRSGHAMSRFRSTNYGSRNPRSTIRETVSSVLDRSGSEERINEEFPIPLKIYQKREVEVSTLPAGPDYQRQTRRSSSESLHDGMRTVVNVKGGSHSSRHYEDPTSEKSIV